MKHPDPHAELRKAIAANGTIARLAEKSHVASSHISNVLAGKRSFGPRLLDAIGLEKVVTYRRVR